MSGSVNIAGDVPPTPVTPSDGVVVTAATHLKPIKYPVRLNDIAVVGRPGPWQRSFLLRPSYGGRFLLIMYPKGDISEQTVILRSVTLEAFNSSPELVTVHIPTSLRAYRDWQWRLVKTHGANSIEQDYEEKEIMLEPSSGMLTGRSAEMLAWDAEQHGEWSRLIYDLKPVMEGQVGFHEEFEGHVARLLVWSCHQPFETDGDVAVIWKHSEAILHWYKNIARDFSPHRVWALGDSSYSDGTSALNFTRQVDGKTGWQNNWDLRKDLLSLYRLNYRYHWSFDGMQAVMREFPHLGMWDDHEIRDGYGSDDRDFVPANKAIRDIASQAAEEYLFQYSPRLRSEAGKHRDVDNHQAYMDMPVAAFVFDGRNNRDYGDDLPVPPDVPVLLGLPAVLTNPVFGLLKEAATIAITNEINDIYRWHNHGRVISDQQLKDFANFCQQLKGQPGVKYLLLGNSVPFIYVLDFLETLASEMAITATDTGHNIRDDIRDSWHSPANRRQLSKLVDILRDLHLARPDMEFINLSGDIHISNAFTFQPPGFDKPLYQVTSSALTNRCSVSEEVTNLMSVGGPLSVNAESKILGPIERLWHSGKFQNFLSIDADEFAMRLHLHVFNKEDDMAFGKRDQVLVIRPGDGYQLNA